MFKDYKPDWYNIESGKIKLDKLEKILILIAIAYNTIAAVKGEEILKITHKFSEGN